MRVLSLISFICALLLFGCRTRTEYIESPSVYVLHDTIMRNALRVDSVMVRDSVYVDGQTIYRERYVYKTRLLTDTVYKARTDTVTATKVIVRQIKGPTMWYEKALQYLGLMALGGLLIFIGVFYIRRQV